MSWKPLAILATLLGVSYGALLGCREFHIEAQPSPGVDFANLKTFSFSSSSSDTPEGFITGHLFNSIMQRRIRAELYRDLTNKGFRQAARKDASFIISFSTGGRQDIQPLGIQTRPAGEGKLQSAAKAVSLDALVIHFIDPQTRRILWRGRAEAVMQPEDNLDEKVRSAVRQLMQEFPPQG